MPHTELPLPHAFRALQDIVQSESLGPDDALTFPLTWLAAARMVHTGHVPGVSKVDALVLPGTWSAVEKAGLPLPGSRWLSSLSTPDSAQLLTRSTQVVKELVADLGSSPWDVLPTLTAAIPIAHRYSAPGMLSLAVTELMLDMLEQPSGSLWIPFDHWGTVTLSALRRGWRVKTAQMMGHTDSTLPLLLTIEYGYPHADVLDADIERDAEGRPLTRADCVLALPPFAVPVRDTKLLQWDSSQGVGFKKYQRSETWVMQELMRRTQRKAVFLVPPNVLFGRGQEERLREHLLPYGTACNELHSVIGLPGGAWSSTHLATALVVMTPGQDNQNVWMAELSVSRRSTTHVDELVRSGREIALGLAQDGKRARQVWREDIWVAENIWSPARYLAKKVEVGPNALPLYALCELLRPPVLSREDDAVERLELGMNDFKGWNSVAGSDLDKVARVRLHRQLPTLQANDVVLSVKGTIGKAALVGDVEPEAVVLSQACLGLRLKPGQSASVSPQYLLMYLRSAAGQAQLQSLQAGATIQHISPQTLLNAFLVPLPTAQERQGVENDYQRLCELERQIKSIESNMQYIITQRWKV